MAVNYKALINWQQVKKYSVSHTENGKSDGGFKAEMLPDNYLKIPFLKMSNFNGPAGAS